MLRFSAAILVGMAVTSGCAQYHPYLQSEQVDRIRRDVDYLVESREQIEQRIRLAGSLGALVPIPVGNYKDNLVIYTGNGPTDALVEGQLSSRMILSQDSKVCYFVYAASAGMPPERWACQTLFEQVAGRAKLKVDLSTTAESIAAHQMRLATLGTTLEEAVSDIAAIREREVSRNDSLLAVIKLLRQHERHLKLLQETQVAFAQAINTTTSLQPDVIKALQNSLKAQDEAQKIVFAELRNLREKIEAIK